MTRRLPGLRPAAAAGLTVLLVGTGTLASHAYWTAQTTHTATVTAATVSATSTGTEALNLKYTAGIPEVFPPGLSGTAPVTVTNTGTAPLGFTMGISGGSEPLNALIAVDVWKQTDSCTAATPPDPASSSSGTLAAPPALNPAARTVQPGQTLTLCVRTTLTGAFPASEQTTTPSIRFTGTIGTNWTTTTTAASFTQRAAFDWFQIVQSTTGKCLQAEGAGAATGQDIVNADCTAPAPTNNQAFRLLATDSDYYRLYPGTGTAAGAVVSGRPSALFGLIPSVVELAAAVSGTTTAARQQQWQPVRHGAAGDFQIMNRDANLCLTMPGTANSTTATITACTSSTNTATTAYRNQHYRLTPIP